MPFLEATENDSLLTKGVSAHQSWKKVNVFLAVIILCISVFSGFHQSIQRNAEVISPIDEWSYIDSVYQASHFGIVRPGEEVSLEGKAYIACHDIWGVGRIGAKCGDASQPASSWPLAGKSPAEIHPPTYFLATGITARILDKFPFGFGFVDSSRFIGAFWLIFGLLIWLNIYRRLGADIISATSVAILVALSPLVVSSNTFISPDATFALSSGVVVLAAMRYLRGELNPHWLILAGLFPVMFKVTHLLTSIEVASLLIFLSFTTMKKNRKSVLLASTYLLVGTLSGLVGWQIIRKILRVDVSPIHPEEAPAITLRNFVAEFGYHFSVLPQSSTSPIPVPWLSVQIAIAFSLLLAAASIGGFMFSKSDSEFFAISIIATSWIYFGAAILSLITVVIAGGFLIATSRYGLPLLLLWTIPLTIASSRRMGHLLLAPLATGAYLAIMFGAI